MPAERLSDGDRDLHRDELAGIGVDHLGDAAGEIDQAARQGKVEVGVQVVGRWILARLRHRRFFSLADLNAAIRLLLADLD